MKRRSVRTGSPISRWPQNQCSVISLLNCIRTNQPTWKTVSPWSSGILRNDSSRSRDTDDSMFSSQWESVSCRRLNCSKCLTISANDCMELERRWQTLLHRVVMEATCFLMRSESYWSVDFESSSARLVIFSSCGLRSSISAAMAYWNNKLLFWKASIFQLVAYNAL